MTITSLLSLILQTTAILLTVSLCHFLSPSLCLSHHKQPSSTIQGVLVEEKTRLGSTPPSCHNKCNQCHPCMAVQVPTLPSHGRVQPSSLMSYEATKTNPMGYFDPSPSYPGNRYSNYKPLGWKCRCGGHFFNP